MQVNVMTRCIQMSNVNFNMRLDKELKASVVPVFERYGLTPSQAVKLFFTQVANTQQIPLSFDWADSYKKPTDSTLKAIQEIDSGQTTKFKDLNDFVGVFSENN